MLLKKCTRFSKMKVSDGKEDLHVTFSL